DLVAVVQGRAGVRYHQFALLHAFANLDRALGEQADAHAPGFHHLVVAYHLHARSFGAIEHRGFRDRHAAAAAGVDGGAGEFSHPQRGIAFDADAPPAELALRVDLGRKRSHTAGEVALVFGHDAHGLLRLELRNVNAWDLGRKLDLAIDG